MTVCSKPKEHRTLVIKNFRNLAPFCAGNEDDSNDLKEFLTLNRSLFSDEVGGLVILVSANNCGKSNVLDAIEKYDSQTFSIDDYTDFTFKERVDPTIGMNIANGAYGDLRVPRRITSYDGRIHEVLLAFILEKENYELYLEYMNSVSTTEYYVKPESLLRNDGGRTAIVVSFMDYISKMYGVFKPLIEGTSSYSRGNSPFPEADLLTTMLSRDGVDISDPDIQIGGISRGETRINADKRVRISSTGICIDDYLFTEIDFNHTSEEDDLTKQSVDSPILRNVRNTLKNVKVNHSTRMDRDSSMDNPFIKRYGYNLSDRVCRYDRERISQTDLVCRPDELNEFFINLVKVLGYDISALKNAYDGAKNFRFKVEKEMNKSLERLSDELNDLLNINDKKYSLRIELERENLEFIITYGDDVPLNLDRQSEGFRWLFDLFFNLLKSKDFEPGDIILMDEFGNSLNCSTVKELTKKLRNYARKNGITFVLATQHPMAVDSLHLDEVRLLVPNDDGSTHIINNFNNFGESGNPDLMEPVLNALTVGRNILRSENRRTVFVEGVTDYFYLNSISEVLRSKGEDVDIDFVPINGLGNPKDNPKRILSQIRSIERNPIMFIDGDKAGIAFKEAAMKVGIEPSMVSEIFDDSKKEIEELFSKADAERLGIFDVESGKFVKSFDLASCLSYKMMELYDSLDEETRMNFRKLIDYIQNQ